MVPLPGDAASAYRWPMPGQIDQEPWLSTLRAELPRAAAGDPEAVHQLRVALARLRVFAELSRDPGTDALDDELRWLRGTAAALRDLDIQLARPDLPASYATSLADDRAAAESRLRDALEHPRAAALCHSLATLAPLSRTSAERGLARLSDHALAYGDAVREDDPSSLHALRRAVRRTRFALEWLGEHSERLVALQSALGAFNDASIARVRAESEPGPETKPLRRYRRALDRELRETMREIARVWKRARPELASLAEGKRPGMHRVTDTSDASVGAA